MLPSQLQKSLIPIDSSLIHTYPTYPTSLGPLAQNFNQFYSPMYQQQLMETYYSSLFLQNTKILFENALSTQMETDVSNNSLCQNQFPTKMTNKIKERTATSDSCSKASVNAMPTQLNASSDTSLNQNLELSQKKKVELNTMATCEKASKKSLVAKMNKSYRLKALLEKESDKNGIKRIKKNGHELKNQLELHNTRYKLIRPLNAKDCSFESNDESDSENIKQSGVKKR